MANKKKIVILGSTGEIGRHALNIVDKFPELFEVIGLSCLHNSSVFQEQIKKYQPRYSCVASEKNFELETLAALPELDLVIVAVVGKSGLKPTLAAINQGNNVALATKEVLVLAGKEILDLARKKNVNILPIDSEHSAIFQSLHAGKPSEIEKIYLTMGSGKIAKMSIENIGKLKPKTVLKKNQWKMGTKITIDAATCVNKVFEALEAAYLFNLKSTQIQIVVHPEYLCHSLVEFVDGSIIGEFGSPDMDRYLQYAMFYPNRFQTTADLKINLLNTKLTFLSPNEDKFPVLKLIPMLIDSPSSFYLPSVFYGADEILTKAFLDKKINFLQIGDTLIKVMTKAKKELVKKPFFNETVLIKNIEKAENFGCKLAKEFLESKKHV